MTASATLENYTTLTDVTFEYLNEREMAMSRDIVLLPANDTRQSSVHHRLKTRRSVSMRSKF